MPAIIRNPRPWQDRMAAHIAADDLIQGEYYDAETGKGCFIGCSVHDSDPQMLEDEIGFPVMLSRIAEAIFEGLPLDEAREFTRRMADPDLIREGADLSLVGWKFQLWLLTDPTVNPGIEHETVRAAVERVVTDVLLPLSKGEPVSKETAEGAEGAARSAARSAESAERSAARAAESAARAAESAAWSAARAAESAAESAAWSAAESAARAAWGQMADKLISLIAEAA